MTFHRKLIQLSGMLEPAPLHSGGKIKDMIRTTTSSKSDLHFDYDAMGNRICKIVKPRNGSGIMVRTQIIQVKHEIMKNKFISASIFMYIVFTMGCNNDNPHALMKGLWVIDSLVDKRTNSHVWLMDNGMIFTDKTVSISNRKPYFNVPFEITDGTPSSITFKISDTLYNKPFFIQYLGEDQQHKKSMRLYNDTYVIYCVK